METPTADTQPAMRQRAAGLVLIVLPLLLGWFVGWGAMIALFGFVALIALHEVGHYIVARRAGMCVEEAFIGFGPRIWSTTRGETEFGVKAIPAGAYVRVSGMTNLEVVLAADEHRTYRQGRYRDRLAMVLAGPFMNLGLAFAGLIVMFATFGFVGIDVLADGAPDGWEHRSDWVVTHLAGGPDNSGTTAQAIGIQPGDRIAAVDGESMNSFVHVLTTLRAMTPGDQVAFTISRDGSTFDRSGQLDAWVDPQGVIQPVMGIRGGVAAQVPQRQSIPGSFVSAAGEFPRLAQFSVGQLSSLFAPSTLAAVFGLASEPVAQPVPGSGQPEPAASPDTQVRGPIGLVHDARDASLEGLLFIWVLVNILVAMFNLIPLLPFDGGHAVVATYERLRSFRGERHIVDVGRLAPIVYTVVIAMVMLGTAIAFRDVQRVIS